MDINQIKFGTYSIGTPKAGVKKDDAKAEVKAAAASDVKQYTADDVLNALAISGLQNKAMVAKKEVNPSDYLSDERISDIEAMMGEFEAGVLAAADIVGAEFPELQEDTKLALAAQLFAKE